MAPDLPTTVFLIMVDTDRRAPVAVELRESGFLVGEYSTVREFILDKPNQTNKAE